jgi:hypothetical protein
VGKLRAAISKASVTLVRARQSNFSISTPTAVAAARGTVLWAITDGQNAFYAVEPELGGTLIPSKVDCIPVGNVAPGAPLTYQSIFAGSQSMNCGAVTPYQALNMSNPTTANSPLLTGAAIPPPARALEAATANLAAQTPAVAPTSFNTTGSAPVSSAAQSTVGPNITVNKAESEKDKEKEKCVSNPDKPCNPDD